MRPLIGIELARGDSEKVINYPSTNQLQIGGDKCFTFDYVFKDNSQQKAVYEEAIKPLVDSFLQGYNATVIAYGQTGSGKTYTMGTLGCDDSKLEEEWGIIPSAIHDIFRTLQSSKESDDDFKVQCSFIEIYNEEIKVCSQTLNGQEDHIAWTHLHRRYRTCSIRRARRAWPSARTPAVPRRSTFPE